MCKMTDQEIIQNIKKGGRLKEQAISCLKEKVNGVYQIFLYSKNEERVTREDLEELHQDTIMDVVKYIEENNEIRNIIGLYRVILSRKVDGLSPKNKKRPSTFTKTTRADYDQSPEEYIESKRKKAGLSLMEKLDLEEDVKDVLEQAMNTLDAETLKVLVLSYYHGYKQEDIARELRITVTNVKQKKRRGLQKLHEKLKKRFRKGLERLLEDIARADLIEVEDWDQEQVRIVAKEFLVTYFKYKYGKLEGKDKEEFLFKTQQDPFYKALYVFYSSSTQMAELEKQVCNLLINASILGQIPLIYNYVEGYLSSSEVASFEYQMERNGDFKHLVELFRKAEISRADYLQYYERYEVYTPLLLELSKSLSTINQKIYALKMEEASRKYEDNIEQFDAFLDDEMTNEEIEQFKEELKSNEDFRKQYFAHVMVRYTIIQHERKRQTLEAYLDFLSEEFGDDL